MMQENFIFKKVALGGTFDKFHLGHEKLIDTAFKIGEFVIIGITSDIFAKKLKKTHDIASFQERYRIVDNYIKQKWRERRYEIFHLDDPYGPTITDKYLEAVVVSEETVQRGKRINDIRIKNGLRAITLIVVDMVLAEDNLPISSTRIHMGLVNRDGKVLYDYRKDRQKDYTLILKI